MKADNRLLLFPALTHPSASEKPMSGEMLETRPLECVSWLLGFGCWVVYRDGARVACINPSFITVRLSLHCF